MKVLSLLLCFCLVFNYSVLAQVAGPQVAPKPEIFTPLHLRYLSYNQLEDNLNIILDKGNFAQPNASELQESAKPLLNYFFIGISLPSDSFWVNLRPDSPDKMIDPSLEKTNIGRILLEADLQLKKDIAQATSPQVPTGKEYWDKLYKKIDEVFGNAEVSIPTLTRPWIVPDEVIVRETADSAYVYKATLKVMLEGDYLVGSQVYNFKDERLRKLNEYSTQLIKELVLPRLNKEINSSQRYAALRQVYYSLILSQWFKARFAGQPGQYAALIDKKDLSGLTSGKPWDKAVYFKEYQKSFTEREYNLKESVNAIYGRSVKSYYSGGLDLGLNMFAQAPARDLGIIRPEVVRLGVITEARPAIPTTTKLPTRVSTLTGAEATKVVILAAPGPGGFYTQAPVTERDMLFVTGRPGDLKIATTQAAATTQLPVSFQGATRVQKINNGIRLEIQRLVAQAIPALAPETGVMPSAKLEQALTEGIRGVSIKRDIVIIEVPGLFAATSAYGAPEVVHIDLGAGYGRPVVFIDKAYAGNRVVEGYGLEKINLLRNEARTGRIPADMGSWMRQRPQEAIPVLREVNRQAYQRYNLAPIVRGHYAFGVSEFTDVSKGLPEANIFLATALQNLPVHMDRITEIGRKALAVVLEGPTGPVTPARQLLGGIMAQPLAQQVIFMGTMEKFRESALARTGGEQVLRFAELVLRTKEALMNAPNAPNLSPVEKAVLNPTPVVSETLKLEQPVSITREKLMLAAAPAAAVTTAAQVEVRAPEGEAVFPIQFEARPEGDMQAVVLGVPLKLGTPVFVRVAAPAAPGMEGIRLIAQEIPPAAQVAPALMRVELVKQGLVVEMTQMAPQANIAVTAFSSQPVTGLTQVPLTIPVTELAQAQPTTPAPGALTPGGIDLRILPIITQPLSNLSANLSKSTLRSLRNLDLDKEWEAIEKMIQADMIPSAERIKEGIQASCLQGEISLDIDRIVLDISKIFKIEEARYAATEPALRDILVVLGAASSPAEISQVFLGKI